MADNVFLTFRPPYPTPKVYRRNDDGELGHSESPKLPLVTADSNYSTGRFRERLGDVEHVLG